VKNQDKEKRKKIVFSGVVLLIFISVATSFYLVDKYEWRHTVWNRGMDNAVMELNEEEQKLFRSWFLTRSAVNIDLEYIFRTVNGSMIISEEFINPDTIRLIMELEQEGFKGMLDEREMRDVLRVDSARLIRLEDNDPKLYSYVAELLEGGFSIIRICPETQRVFPDFNALGFIRAINHINNYHINPDGQFNYIDNFWRSLL